jgi:integrase/recombinase XerD
VEVLGGVNKNKMMDSKLASTPGLSSMSDLEAGMAWLHSKTLSTRGTYDITMRQFTAFIKNNTDTSALRGITTFQLESFKEMLVRRGLSPATIRSKLGALKSLFSYLHRSGHIERNPAILLTRPKSVSTSSTDRVLSEAEAKIVIDGAGSEGNRDRVFIALLYKTGLRISEACGVRDHNISVHEEKGAATITVVGKGEKVRRVHVPHVMASHMLALAQAFKGQRKGRSNPVFHTINGTQLSRRLAHNIVKRAFLNAGVNPLASAHWLRHSHASHAIKRGCRLEVLRSSLGHASLATTSLYLHPDASESSSAFIQ